jgi:hypothetical protein
MEIRSSKRISVELNAMLVSRSLKYKGIIKDCSSEGICILIHTEENICQLLNDMMFEVESELPSREKINLQCKVIRTHIDASRVPGNTVGMIIIHRPPEFMQFLNVHS